MEFTYRPLDQWPGEETKHRQRSRFATGWGRTLTILQGELDKLNAKNILMLVAVEPHDFRIRDGHPKSNARWYHPGVVLSFDSKHGPLKYACDTFDQFPDNVHAIALGLAALRQVERYGITNRGEQYRGWSALPPATVMGAPMTKDEAAAVLADLAYAGQGDAGDLLASQGVPDRPSVEHAYRLAVKLHHPDRGGDPDLFRRATEARDVLLA